MLGKFSTMDELYEMAEAHNSACHDTRGVNVRALRYEAKGNRLHFSNGFSQEGELFGKVANIGESGTLAPLALGQLNGRIGGPDLRWLKDEIKCPDELKETLLNWKFQNWPEAEYLLRQKLIGEVNTVRGVLSSDYSIYDNFEFIDAVKDAVETAGLDVHVFRPKVEDVLRAYIIIKGIDFEYAGEWTGDEEAARENPMGDGSRPAAGRNGGTALGNGGGNGGLQPAIYITNNELGGGKARVVGGLYRSWCANGAIVGWEQTNQYAVTHRFKSKAHMHLKVNEGIADAMKLSEKAAIAFLDKRAIMIKKSSIPKIIDRWADKYGLLLETRENWQKSLRLHSDMFETVNAAAPINQLTTLRSESAAEQENIERCAGEMLMAQVEWADRVDEA